MSRQDINQNRSALFCCHFTLLWALCLTLPRFTSRYICRPHISDLRCSPASFIFSACVRNFLRRDVLSSAESFINLALNSQIIPALHHVQFSHFGTFPARPCFLLVEQDVGVRRRRRFATGGDAATLPLQLKLRRDATQHKAVSGRTQAP